jgi:uncharacterized protein (UPF0332 family)
MNWKELSAENEKAAQLNYEAGLYRASVSRAYYAIYQLMTDICIEHGDASQFPTGWNNPSHAQLPDLIKNNGDLDITARRKISGLLRSLRDTRETADYRPGRTIDRNDAHDALNTVKQIKRSLGYQE